MLEFYDKEKSFLYIIRENGEFEEIESFERAGSRQMFRYELIHGGRWIRAVKNRYGGRELYEKVFEVDERFLKDDGTLDVAGFYTDRRY
jgi:hypothetical protein